MSTRLSAQLTLIFPFYQPNVLGDQRPVRWIPWLAAFVLFYFFRSQFPIFANNIDKKANVNNHFFSAPLKVRSLRSKIESVILSRFRCNFSTYLPPKIQVSKLAIIKI